MNRIEKWAKFAVVVFLAAVAAQLPAAKAQDNPLAVTTTAPQMPTPASTAAPTSTPAPKPAPPQYPLHRTYHEGETLAYQMKGQNEAWHYTIRADGIVTKSPTGPFLEEYRWSAMESDGKPVTLTLAGDGEEMPALKAQVQRLGLTEAARFIGHVKARYGFSKGGLLVVPSRGDSMPYVVIEAAAAGIPMVAAKVGGIPEIFGSDADALFAPNAVGAMADAIETALEDPVAALARAKSLRERVLMHFSQKAMVEGVLAGYRDAFADR